jgi:3-methyladenine DNA glycosylase/8-oxoguanine DNA glycosylase
MAAAGALEVEVRPPWPYKLPRGGGDGVMRSRGGASTRLLQIEGAPIVVRAWQPARDRVRLRADPVDPRALAAPPLSGRPEPRPPRRADLELAIERMRFALAVDDDLSDFYRAVRGDRLLTPLIRRMPWLRPRRRPWPWEALAWAITKQLIDSPRAAAIQRRIVWRWGPRLGDGRRALRDVPCAAVMAGRAPAELESMDLAGRRAVALCRVARQVAAGRCELSDPSGDARLLAIPNIGPWTVQCLGLGGRGEPDSLPAGDLGYVKLVGRLTGLGRRATVEEVEEFYAPYAPYRGLAGVFTLVGLHHKVGEGPPLSGVGRRRWPPAEAGQAA